MRVLVTGGAGYIGSHTSLELLQAGYDVHVVDNLSNSCETSLHRIQEMSGKSLSFYPVDLRDEAGLMDVLDRVRPQSVLHFAGLKAVGESVADPLSYYENNVVGTLSLIRAMKSVDCHSMVFSSSATVYGAPDCVPISENAPLRVTNPYGRTKLMIEEIFSDLGVSDPRWCVTLLRYFNPVGAHESGRIGEDPKGAPNNLAPFISQVAVGRREALTIFGDDYPTKDGTGVRDYIHVVDLALGHLAALKHTSLKPGVHVFNLGTGEGVSVLEMVAAFRLATGHSIPYTVAPRRAGDIATCFADPSRAREVLGWEATRTLRHMATDTWRWQSQNPMGYEAQGLD